MALAQIQEIARRRLVDRSNRLGRRLRSLLEAIPMPAGFRAEIRGLGLMIGLALYDSGGQPAGALVWRLVTGLLQRGVLVLPEGDQGHVLGFTPPLIVTDRQLLDAIHLLEETLANEGHA
jgi:4-aminobutyrate aminotransferase-like enzyme